MREYVVSLRDRGGLAKPGMVSGAVLALTSLIFFRVALLPEFGRDLAMSTFQLGAVTTVFAAGRLLADLPGGYMADRWPARRLMGMAAAGVGLGSLLLGASGSPLPVYVAALLLGLSSATTNTTGMTYFSNAAGSGLRGTSMAVFSAGLLGGQAVGPAAAGLIASAGGWRLAMYGAAAVAALVSVTLVWASRSDRMDRRPDSETSVEVLRNGPGWRLMLLLQSVSFVMMFTLGAVPQTLVPLIGSGVLGLNAAAIGLALGLGGFSRFVGTLVGGRLSDRVSRKAALVPGLLIQAAGVGLLALRPTVVTWLAAIVVMSVGSFGVPVAATVLGDLSEPGRVGTQLGRFRFVGDLGLITGPITVSALYAWAGRTVAFLAVTTLIAAVGLAAVWVLPETRPPEGPGGPSPKVA